MRTTLKVLLVLALLPATALADRVIQVDRPQDVPSFLGYHQSRFIVVMKSSVGRLRIQETPAAPHIGDAAFDAISDRFQVSRIRKQFRGSDERPGSPTAELARYHKITITSGTLEEAMAAYRAHPLVERVEPIGIHALYAVPNDFYYSPYQWYHNQASDHDIDSPEAWDIQTGSDATIVAILDSGTRYYHPDLGGANATPANPSASRGNMWINNAELNGAFNVDDDGNGYVDDWIGYDFIETTSNCWPGEDCGVQDADPRDFNGHGTHTSGIFGMITNDGYGMAGVAGGWGNGTQQVTANGVRIMALRMGYSYNHFLYGEVGVVLMDAAAEAFYYAADNGAKIASCSWGSSNSGGIGAAATYFVNSGGLIFVAAGNDGTETPSYLGSRTDCISVAATDQNDAAASFTTYGTWVDISAPGVGIYSTYHDHTDPNTNYWASLDGTSMATPMAAGVAALIWSQNPGWTRTQVENQLYASADNIDAFLAAKYIGKMGAGRINAFNAVNTGTPPPVANFSGAPTSGCAPLLVSFTDASTGDITSWDWSFGDGGTSTAQNPSYTYNAPGTYTVSLTVTGPGGSNTDTKTNYITANGGPTADFSGSPTTGTEPLTVNFTDLSTGGATGWSWAFGDGGTSTAQNPSYTYNAAGTYTVTLTASNACGSDVATKVDYITVNPCVAPTADFSGVPTTGEAPLTVDFTDLSTGAASWDWTFGDGGTSTAQNPSYTYNTAGTYTVTLTASNACGSDVATKVNYITVNPCVAPTADFSGVPTTGEAPLTVDFADLSTGAASWDWTFGDGGTSSAQNPSYTYNAAGIYTVTLTATNACGSDIATKVDYITVDPPTGTKVYAQSEATGRGSVGGSYLDTWAADNTYETITEVESGGKPSNRYSTVEHTWTFNVPAGANVSFFVEGYRTSGADNDDFTFEYSTDNANFTPLVTINSATEQMYSTAMPAVSGTVYIRVVDTDHGQGNNTSFETVHVDYMYIESGGTPPPPDTIYVTSITVTRSGGKANKFNGEATVTVFDQSGAPASGVLVEGHFSGPSSDNQSGTTGADGSVTIQSAQVRNPTGLWCFTVDNLMRGGDVYDPALNVQSFGCEPGGAAVVAAARQTATSVLGYNTPNPFNAGTVIPFTLTESGDVNLTVYDVLGRAVRHLATGVYPAGEHLVSFDGTDDSGRPLSSGMYFYRLQSAGQIVTRQMILLK